MANQNKTNTNQGGQAANQGKQGDPSEWNTQKTGQAGQKPQSGQGAQSGGKNPPTGGPDLYKPNEPMEGKKGSEVGGKGGATDPYPPTNPERPVMGGQQGDEFRGGQGIQSGSKTGQGGSQFGGNVAGAGAIGDTPGAVGGNKPSGLEEEEEE